VTRPSATPQFASRDEATLNECLRGMVAVKAGRIIASDGAHVRLDRISKFRHQ
jgi:hypothetical protein